MADRALPIHEYARQGNLTGLREELAKGVDIDARNPSNDRTPLMEAAASSNAPAEVIGLLVRAGADVNAFATDKQSAATKEQLKDLMALVDSAQGAGNPNSEQMKQLLNTMRTHFPAYAESPAFKENVLSLALKQGDREKIQMLLNSGADVRYHRTCGYDALIDATHGRRIAHDTQLIPILKLLINRGTRLNTINEYSQSALSLTSDCGRFDAVKVLLDAGADPGPLQWTPLMRAIALGSQADVKASLKNKADLSARDFWSRTPWLLSLQTGDVTKAQLLLAAGADRSDRGRCGKVPLMYPIACGHTEMLRWLLSEGFDPSDYDDFQTTPLIQAVGHGEIELVRLLIDAGANVHFAKRHNEKVIRGVRDVETLRLLLEHGADLNDIGDDMRATLTGVPNDSIIRASTSDYSAAKSHRFGGNNPEKMNFPFWKSMIASGACAYAARKHFDDTESDKEPVWCFQRFGKSINILPDGRIVEISGEHEDHYDPDFCIYNDVIVHDGKGAFDIFGYPKSCFPPTDFHTATHIGNYIYLIGNLGYAGERKFGETQVFRLNLDSFAIEPVITHGEKPGWISRHKAVAVGQSATRISEGKVSLMEDDKEKYIDNVSDYILDLETLEWRKLESAR